MYLTMNSALLMFMWGFLYLLFVLSDATLLPLSRSCYSLSSAAFLAAVGKK